MRSASIVLLAFLTACSQKLLNPSDPLSDEFLRTRILHCLLHDSECPRVYQVAFASNRSGNLDVWAVRTDRLSQPWQITNDPGTDDRPAFSADGRFVAFTSTRVTPAQIFVTLADGSGSAWRVTNTSTGAGTPAFSPDGGRIYYQSSDSGNIDIYYIDLYGSSTPVSVVASSVNDQDPVVSPDGSFLIFHSNRAPPNHPEVWRQASDGSGSASQITSSSATSQRPTISGRGDLFAFDSDRSGTMQIYVQSFGDSSSLRQVTNGTAAFVPAFSPMGDWVAYDSAGQVFMVSPNGGTPVQVTQGIDGTHAAMGTLPGEWY